MKGNYKSFAIFSILALVSGVVIWKILKDKNQRDKKSPPNNKPSIKPKIEKSKQNTSNTEISPSNTGSNSTFDWNKILSFGSLPSEELKETKKYINEGILLSKGKIAKPQGVGATALSNAAQIAKKLKDTSSLFKLPENTPYDMFMDKAVKTIIGENQITPAIAKNWLEEWKIYIKNNTI